MDISEIAEEIEITGERIQKVTNRRPFGFRGPDFSCPDEVLQVLARNKNHYDASVFPTSIAPIAGAVFMLKTGLQGEQREKAKKLYGGFVALRQPNRPFWRSIDEPKLWEVPMTVMSFVRTPIHFSYFKYLASFSSPLAKSYFQAALWLCRLSGVAPSILLHPLGFLGREDDSDMAYFPTMNKPRGQKLSIVRWALRRFAESPLMCDA